MLEEEFRWGGGHRAAISLAYERCPRQALRRLSVLDNQGVGATIFVEPTDVLEDPVAWRRALGSAHELGSATLHPVTLDGTLPNWTLAMIDDDLATSDELLDDFDPTPAGRPFAAPGPLLYCADGSYEQLLNNRYRWILGGASGVNHPVFCNTHSLSTLKVNEDTIGETLDALEDGVDRGAWCILSFDLRTEVTRRFHDAFLEVVPNSLERVLWQPISQVGAILAGFRSKLAVR